jgi:hypothetical protein
MPAVTQRASRLGPILSLRVRGLQIALWSRFPVAEGQAAPQDEA